MARKNYTPGNWKLLVKRSSAGLGMFAGERIPKDACIIEYVGKQISEEEAYSSRSKYLFEITKKKTIGREAAHQSCGVHKPFLPPERRAVHP